MTDPGTKRAIAPTALPPRARLAPLVHRASGWFVAGLSYLPHAVVVLAATAAFWALKGEDLFTGRVPELHLPLAAILIALLAPVRAARVAVPLLTVHRTVLLLFTFYALAAYPAQSELYLNESAYSRFVLVHGRWIALACLVPAWFRPGFALVSILLVAWKKHMLGDMFGFRLNATDYFPVAELGVFVCLLIGAVALAERWMAGRGRAVPGRDDARWSLGETAFVAAFSMHLANYFYSAVAKTVLPGAAPWSWVLDNDTHNIMLATASIGLGPLMGHEPLASLAHATIASTWPVLNAVTFVSQALALACLLRIRWAIGLTLFYDALHAGIFLFTSILFWKWMTLNLGLVLALRTLRARVAPPWPVVAIGMGVMLLSPLVFRVASLGWFDSAALNKPVVEAVTDDGRLVRVPSTYFLEGSAEMAKSSIGAPFGGHFERIGAFGKAAEGHEQMLAARECELATDELSTLSESFVRRPELERYFVRHHDWVLEHVDGRGRFAYDLFPHHSWSNPALFREFAALDLRRIVAYRYAIESVCLSYDPESGVRETLRLRGVHEIPVRR